MITVLANLVFGAAAMALLFVVFALRPATAGSCGGCDGCTGSCGAEPGTCPLDDLQLDASAMDRESDWGDYSPHHVRRIPEVNR